jgi:SAM-dependent methyltransferase
MKFYRRVLRAALKSGRICETDSVLVICGGSWDRDNFSSLGFENVTISNLNDFMGSDVAPYGWQRIDAENIPYPDDSVDVVAVHGGLHHCYSPHRALLEMYRVARKAVIVLEARDNWLIRLAKRLGFTSDYEIEAVTGSLHHGGAGGGPIPNFVYRWTEGEVAKTIASFEPRYAPDLQFFYGLLLPEQRLGACGHMARTLAVRLLRPVATAIQWAFPRQGNRFGWVVWKDRLQRHPWITEGTMLDQHYVEETGRIYGTRAA